MDHSHNSGHQIQNQEHEAARGSHLAAAEGGALLERSLKCRGLTALPGYDGLQPDSMSVHATSLND